MVGACLHLALTASVGCFAIRSFYLGAFGSPPLGRSGRPIVAACIAFIGSFAGPGGAVYSGNLCRLRAEPASFITVDAISTDSITRAMEQNALGPSDLSDLLNGCLRSIAHAHPDVSDFRAAAFYVGPDGRDLKVPEGGYAGTLDADVRRLRLTVLPWNPKSESSLSHKVHSGVAGYCFTSGRVVFDEDVLSQTEEKPYVYQRFFASEKIRPDRAMICVPIPNLGGPGGRARIGVLAVSSLSPDALAAKDIRILQLFAAALGRFNPR